MKKNKTSYEDYKYIYTGYKDYCKEHNIKISSNTELSKKEKVVKPKEEIEHDHRLVFDFNNPNQHTHDYSFDFNTQNNTTKKTSTSTKTNKATTYQQTKTTTYTPSNTKTTNTTTYKTTYNINNKKNKNASGCVVTFVIFFIMFFFMIIGIISEGYEDDYYYEDDDYYYEDNYYYDDKYENSGNNNTSYTQAVEDYVNAVYSGDYTSLLNSITPDEEEYDYGLTWKNDIQSIKTLEDPITSGSYSYTSIKSYSYQEVRSLETNFNNKYGANVTMSQVYLVTINLKLNERIIPKTLQIAEINSYWYLISVY